MHWLLLSILGLLALKQALAQSEVALQPRLSTRSWIVEVADSITLLEVKLSVTGAVSRLPGTHAVLIPHEYTSDIFNGFSLHCHSTNSLFPWIEVEQTLAEIQGVRKVWGSLSYHERSISSHALALGGSIAPVSLGNGDSMINAIHNLTHVADLHQTSLSGNGVTVAIVDGGVDYLHPALGGGYGQGFKVQYGYDFVGDNVRPPNREAPDDDPYGDCSNHATHTAGILFGHDITTGFRGVAPGVSVEHYRVFDCNGMSASDVVVQAVLKAYERKVDLINLSLGSGSRPFSDDPLASLVSRINRQGRTFIAVAAGNNGRNGTWSAAAPDGGGDDIFAVGSVDLDHTYSILRPGQATVGSGSSQRVINFTWNPPTWTAWFHNSIPETLPLIALSQDAHVSHDGCDEIAPDPGLYQNKMVLIRRGGCLLKDKMQNLVRAGGQYVLMYDNQPGPVFDLEIRLDGITGGGSVSAETGNILLSLLRDGMDVKLQLDANLILPPVITSQLNLQTPGKVSTFNTWGPSGEGRTVTSLLGPGGRVLSTIPRRVGGWGLQSGSSMAVPYLIGCIALLKEAFPGLSPRDIANALLHTADPVAFNDGTDNQYDFLAPVWQQGAGRIHAFNAFKTLQSKVIITETSLQFNDSEFHRQDLSFTIKNSGDKAMEYNISSISAATVLSLSELDHRPMPMTRALKTAEATQEFIDTLRPLEHVDIAISVRRDDPTIATSESSTGIAELSLAAGQSVTVSVTPNISRIGKFEHLCPLYSGYIVLRSKPNLVQRVSYAGIACQVRSIPTLVSTKSTTFLAAATREDAYMAKYEGRQLQAARPETVFSLPKLQDPMDPKAYTSLVLPIIQVDLSMDTRAITFDLFPAGDERQSIPLFEPNVSHRTGGYGRVETHFFPWTGLLPNGSWAIPGDYQIRISPLRLYGDATNSSDYEDVLVTNSFTLRYDESIPGQQDYLVGHSLNSPCLEGTLSSTDLLTEITNWRGANILTGV